MMFTAVDGTTCGDCGGVLAYGFKDEASGWKAYCDCTDCRKEYGSRYISYEEVDTDDDKHELACEWVRRCSA